MSASELLYLTAVLFIGLPAGFQGWRHPRVRNLTALALNLSWVASGAVYYLTGEGMAIRTMFLADLTVIALIWCKPQWREGGLWRERSPWDRAIVATFPIAWVFYVLPMADFNRYWTLYSLAMAQLVLAGWEAFNPWVAEQAAKLLRAETPPDSGPMFRARRAGYG